MYQLFGRYISELVYGANDGIITTFAVVSGASGAALAPEIVVILGLANLLADGFSMGASNYLSIRSEQDYHGIEYDAEGARKPLKHGTATFVAFVLAGALPLIPFLFGISPSLQFEVSAAATALAFFIVGGMRSFITRKPFFSSGLQMLAIGGFAAAIAYGVGFALHAYVL